MAGLLTHRPGRDRPAPDDRFDRRLILPMVLGSVLNPVNSSMLAVALIPIGAALGAPPAQTAWLVSGLYLATAIGQPVVGRLVDLYGPRPLYLAGSALVGISGLLGALAPSLWVLVVARVLLGLGTCAGYPAAMSLVRGEAARTGRDSPNGVLTVLAVAGQAIVVLGPTVGGLLIGAFDWRATFTVNIPLALGCLLFGVLRLPRGGGVPAPAGTRFTDSVDLVGIGLFVATLLSLLLFLTTPSVSTLYLPAITVLAAGALVWWELRAPTPFLDLRVLAGNIPLLATYLRTLLTAVVSYSFLYGYTQWLEQGRGLSATTAGLLLMPMSVLGIAISAATGRRAQVRGKLMVGAVAQIAGCALLLLAGPVSPIWLLIGIALVLGVPQGLNNLANQNAMYRQSDPARTGSSAGLYRTFFYLGAISASAANGLFLGHGADTAGVHDLAVFAGACAVVFLLVTVVDRTLGRIATSAPAPTS